IGQKKNCLLLLFQLQGNNTNLPKFVVCLVWNEAPYWTSFQRKTVFIGCYGRKVDKVELRKVLNSHKVSNIVKAEPESLNQAMALAVNYITEDDAFGWFNQCGLFT
ncbi:MAG: hypothetical protein ACYT04_50675, partial [Nostoc sp.]